MSPNLSIVSNGKKFMWDGQLYATKEEASQAEETYRKDNFEVQSLEQEQKFVLYTRRVAKEIVAPL